MKISFVIIVFLILKTIECTGLNHISIHDPSNQKGVYLPLDYDKGSPPIIGHPLPVDVFMNIHRVSNVNEKSSAITIDLSLTVKWEEPRFLYNNLRNWNLNPVLREKNRLKSLIWIPNLYFIDTERSQEIKGAMGPIGSISVFRNGTVIQDNRLKLTIGNCKAKFESFPFDSMLCKVRGVPHDDDSGSVQLFSYIFFKAMDLNVVSNYKIEIQHLPGNNSVHNWKGRIASIFGIDIRLKRKSSVYILRNFVPSQLFVCLSWLSFFVPPKIIAGRLGILLVSILGIKDDPFGLELSSYTALEIWNLLCRVQILICLLEYVIVIKLQFEEENDDFPVFTTSTCQINGGLFRRSSAIETTGVFDRKQRVQKCIGKIESRVTVMLPILSVLVNVGFWIHFLLIK